MPNFERIPQAEFEKMLGAGIADVSSGNLFALASKKQVLENTRALIIGVGGNGCRTLDALKHKITSEFGNWQQKIAFLAVDTARGDLEALPTIDLSEQFVIPCLAGIQNRWNIPAMRSPFGKSWINPSYNQPNIAQEDGGGRNRQTMKAKLYDFGDAANPNDLKFENKLRTVFTTKLNFAPNTTLQVIIILGVSGGTGSGGIIEIPHLVHKALSASAANMKVYGYFFMPDTCEEFAHDITALTSYHANGYAALKELEYYMCARQRAGYVDALQTHTGYPAASLEISTTKQLYDMPFIVSAPAGELHKNDYVSNAIVETISNSFAAQATDDAGKPVFLMQSWESNFNTERDGVLALNFDPTTGDELPGFYSEDSFQYSAIGVGTASMPDKELKSYTISRMLKVVKGETAAAALPDFKGFTMIPLGQVEADARIRPMIIGSNGEITRQIDTFCRIEWPATLQKPSKSDILQGNTATLPANLGENPKKQAAITAIEKWLDEKSDTFLRFAKEFIEEHGPRAFVNMAEGITTAAPYDGILTRIGSLANVPANEANRINAKVIALDAAKKEVDSLLSAVMQSRIAKWCGAYCDWLGTRVADEVRKHVFGDVNMNNGAIHKHYILPIRTFVDNCKDFAFVLDRLMELYSTTGSAFDGDFTAYINGNNGESLNHSVLSSEDAYNWAQRMAINAANNANYKDLKKELIDSFFENMDQWCEAGNSNVVGSLPARSLFDSVLAKYVDFKDPADGSDRISIVSYINYEQQNNPGGIANIIVGLIRGAINQATLLYNKSHEFDAATLSSGKKTVLIPSSVYNPNKADIDAAFDHERNIKICPSGAADKVLCYNASFALPLYAIDGLRTWQAEYVSAAGNGLNLHGNESGTGDFDPEKGLEWAHYPEIYIEKDPRLPLPGGTYSYEGRFLRTRFDPVWDEAVRLGVISEKTDAERKYYYEFIPLTSPQMHGIAADFRADALPQDEDGLLSTGVKLIAHLFEIRGLNMNGFAKRVTLERTAGKFSGPNSDRARALKFAKRSLRRNVKMYLDVKKTLEILRPIYGIVEGINAGAGGWAEFKRGIRARKDVAQLVAYGILEKNGTVWSITDHPRPGNKKQLCNMNPFMFQNNELEKKQLAEGMAYWILGTRYLGLSDEDKQALAVRSNEMFNEVGQGHVPKDDCLARMAEINQEARNFATRFGNPTAANKAVVVDLIGADRTFDMDNVHNLVMDVYRSIIELYDNINLL